MRKHQPDLISSPVHRRNYFPIAQSKFNDYLCREFGRFSVQKRTYRKSKVAFSGYLNDVMGTIAQLFESGKQSSNKGHFNNLVMLARIDGKVDETETKLLKRIANRLSLTDEQVTEILNHSDQYPMMPPVSKEERYERFIQLIQMTFVDGEIDPSERTLVTKYGTALGFSSEEIDQKFAFILEQLKAEKSKDEILSELL